MESKIRYTEDAVADLEEILAYSWAEFPDTTESFVIGLLDAIERLIRFPKLGLPIRGGPGVREFVHRPIVIQYLFYEDDRVVQILRLMHSSRRR